MKKRSSIKINRVLFLLLITLIIFGTIFYSVTHYFEQKNRREIVCQFIEEKKSIINEINNMKKEKSVDKESFDGVKKLALNEVKQNYIELEKYDCKDRFRVNDTSFEKIEKIKSKADLKFYRFLKLTKTMGDEACDYYKFLMREPEQRINYALELERAAQYQKAPKHHEESLKEVPLLLQWDTRWGFIPYGDMRIEFSGCGPTCLAMVLSYLNQDDTITPAVVAKYSEEKNFYVKGAGTSFQLMEEAGKQYKVNVEGVYLDQKSVKKALTDKKILIASVKPGDFTTTGHFIVIRGLKNGKLQINDPNSKINSDKLWDVKKVLDQTAAIWAYSK